LQKLGDNSLGDNCGCMVADEVVAVLKAARRRGACLKSSVKFKPRINQQTSMSRPLSTQNTATPANHPTSTRLPDHSAATSDVLWPLAIFRFSTCLCVCVLMICSLEFLLQLPSIFAFPAFLAFLALMFQLFGGQLNAGFKSKDGDMVVCSLGLSKPAFENVFALESTLPSSTAANPVGSSSARLLTNGGD
jgi:hypothetical protein